ncbi:hypothetical protein GJAV_G00149590 [Gymnothorax javanicus]|nr:hypothetical protein GJAV_G00149590 [Gymnothorax javanicus]
MVDEKCTEGREKAKEEVERMSAVSLTSDMRTSIKMEAYLAITCYLSNENDKERTKQSFEECLLNDVTVSCRLAIRFASRT